MPQAMRRLTWRAARLSEHATVVDLVQRNIAFIVRDLARSLSSSNAP